MDPETVLTFDELHGEIDKSVSAAVSKVLNPMEAKLADFEKLVALKGKAEVEKTAVIGKGTEVAVVADSGILNQVMSFEVAGIPIGEAAVGGFVAIIASELIDGILAKQSKTTKAALKLGGAFAAVKFGKGILGNTGSKAVALLLTFDALRDLTPIDEWGNKLANKVSGVIPVGGLGDQHGSQGKDLVNKQADKILTLSSSQQMSRR
jgi:hypothetical protein